MEEVHDLWLTKPFCVMNSSLIPEMLELSAEQQVSDGWPGDVPDGGEVLWIDP